MTIICTPAETALSSTDCAVVLVAVAPERGTGVSVLHTLTGRVLTACAGYPLRWAFTGGARDAPGLRETLAALRAEGICRAALQPLYCIPGQEYTDLLEAAYSLRRSLDFAALCVGAPLLADSGAVRELARIMRIYADTLAGPDEAIVWVGHGTEHTGQALYEELGALLRRDKCPLTLMATLKSGVKDVAAIVSELLALDIKRALLVPFFALPRPRSLQELGGSDCNSWCSRLKDAGIACRMIRSGLAEEEAFAAIWCRRLEEALRRTRSQDVAGVF